MFRSLSLEDQTFSNLKVDIPEVEIHTIHICENAPLINQNINVKEFSGNYSLTPLAISRGQQIISLPTSDFKFQTNDILFLLGPASKIPDILPMFRTSEDSEKC
jgi:K+/H+ antiporter YhaU regulatory subunit KhtT